MLLAKHQHRTAPQITAGLHARSLPHSACRMRLNRGFGSHNTASWTPVQRLAARGACLSLSARGRRTAVAPTAYLNSSERSSGNEARPGQLKVLVVGASPVGLATAVSLALAGCAVEVHDSRPDPRDDRDADSSSSLVGLGKRGLDALTLLNLPPPSSSGHEGPHASSPSNLWTPESANLSAFVNPEYSAPRFQPQAGGGAVSAGSGDTSRTSGSMAADLVQEPLPGLTLLQGMAVMGPKGLRIEEYSRPASRSKPGGGSGVTAGIVTIDEHTLTTRLLEAATAAPARSSARQPQLVLPGSQAAAGPTSGTLKPKGTTSITQGPTSAGSAEAAQEAALPPVVPAPGTVPGEQGAEGGDAGGAFGEEGGSVEVHYGSHLTLLDAANKQATVTGSEGQARIVSYDVCIAADASGGGHLVASALHELQDRQAAHQHPSAHSHAVSTGHGHAEVVEMEYKAWHDLPQDPSLAALVGKGASTTSSTGPTTGAGGSGGPSSSPQQGWLLVWTGTGGKQEAHPGLSSAAAAGSGTAILPGGPNFTVMAWPSKGGDTWSGCVFTYPQVFEALRSQEDLERVLKSVWAPDKAGSGAIKLPAAWVQGIAEQLRRTDRTGRVPCPVSAPPHHLSAPSAGLVTLTPAAVPSTSPQLLNPGVALGLAEASALAAALAEGFKSAGPQGLVNQGGGSTTATAEGLRTAVQLGLKRFDEEYGPEAQALHKLLAQLSWLRHPYSPAAPAAAAASAVPFGTLAWIGAILGAPRTGITLQWKCLLAVLPLVTAVQRVLLYKLGLGRAERTAAAAASSRARGQQDDPSYRKPQPAGAASTSLDSGVHLDSNGHTTSAQRRKEAPAAGPSAGVAATAPSGRGPAYSLSGVSESVEPCGRSFMAFLHTTDMRPTGIWRLLQVAPLIASLLWGFAWWALAQAIWWGCWAFRALGWAKVAMA